MTRASIPPLTDGGAPLLGWALGFPPLVVLLVMVGGGLLWLATTDDDGVAGGARRLLSFSLSVALTGGLARGLAHLLLAVTQGG